MEQNRIIINLKKSLAAHKYSESERIHKKAFDRAINRISEQLDRLHTLSELSSHNEEDRDNFDIERAYNTISVLGDRGTGKTSFLLSLREEVINRMPDVLAFRLIDPTMIEEKGHIFLLIISIIDEYVQNKFYQIKDKNILSENRTRWRNAKEKLAQGLPSLDHVGLTYSEPQWQEDDFIMNKGMQSLKAAFHLEENFHNLVNLALEILGKKAFLLMFDDTDVDFRRGWMVLETIRKYLTSPRIITVLSGNMRLFSKNVRKRQWDNFGKGILKNEADANNVMQQEYVKLVDELENQYFQKILKNENRIYLYSLSDYIQEGEINFTITDALYKKYSLKEYYSNCLRGLGITCKEAIDSFIEFMTSTSFRTQIHFLYNLTNMTDNSLFSSVSSFSSIMYSLGVDVDLTAQPRQTSISALRFLLDKNLVEDNYDLLPKTEMIDFNFVLAGLYIIFVKNANSTPYIPIDYWLRVVFLSNVLQQISFTNGDAPSKSNFMHMTGLLQNISLDELYGNVDSYFYTLGNGLKLTGEKEIYGLASTQKKSARELEGRIDLVLTGVKTQQKILAYLPMLALQSSSKNSKSLRYSVMLLLAKIGHLLRNTSIEEIQEQLVELSTPRSYQLGGDSNEDAFLLDNDNFSEFIDQDDVNLLADKFYKWGQNYQEFSGHVEPLFLSKALIRFSHSLLGIDSSTSLNVGVYMELAVTALYNSVLIEEDKMLNGSNAKLNTNNIKSSTKGFLINLQKIEDYVLLDDRSDEFTFSRWLMACPLLLPFLSSNIIEYVQRFTSRKLGHIVHSFNHKNSLDNSIMHLLEKVSIK